MYMLIVVVQLTTYYVVVVVAVESQGVRVGRFTTPFIHPEAELGASRLPLSHMPGRGDTENRDLVCHGRCSRAVCRGALLDNRSDGLHPVVAVEARLVVLA